MGTQPTPEQRFNDAQLYSLDELVRSPIERHIQEYGQFGSHDSADNAINVMSNIELLERISAALDVMLGIERR
jgi:hypothetical protein